MRDQNMTDILWMDECDTGSARTGKCHVGFSKPGVNYCHAYVRIDIAERMAEALDAFTRAIVTPNGQIVGLMREDFERAAAALSAFKDSAR